MKKAFSPLLWICAAAATLLGALALLDPRGGYAAYRADLPPQTPAIAAVFTAAQDGVFPWTTAAEPTELTEPDVSFPPSEPEPPAPDYSGPDISDSTAPVIAVIPPAPPAQSAPAVSELPEPEPDPEPESVPEVSIPQIECIPVDGSYFDDALFFGDSRIEGLDLYGRLPQAAFYWQRGLTVWSAVDKAFIEVDGETLTLEQALAKHAFGKIYLMLGVNELGKGTTESFAAQYGMIVKLIRRLQPDAIVYILAGLHVTSEKSESSIYRNDVIDARNAALARLADGEHVFYLDCNPAFDGEDGALIPAYTGDGVHLMAPYYVLWRDYLMEHAIVKETAANLENDEETGVGEPAGSASPPNAGASEADTQTQESQESDLPQADIPDKNDPASD